jgi:NADPH:quinone reductase-like Zn-dependent oxidoreductase
MRAAVCTRYGPPEVLQLREVDKPVPRDDEVLIQIRATTVTSSDWFIRSALSSAPITTQILMRLVMGATRRGSPS